MSPLRAESPEVGRVAEADPWPLESAERAGIPGPSPTGGGRASGPALLRGSLPDPGDPRTPSTVPPPPRPPPGPPSPEAEELKPILVTLDYAQLDPDTQAPPATRELQVGCIRTTQLSAKKVTTALPWPPWHHCSHHCPGSSGLCWPCLSVVEGWAACWSGPGAGLLVPGSCAHPPAR